MDKIKRDVFLLEDEKVYNKLDKIVEWIENISERMGRLEGKNEELRKENKLLYKSIDKLLREGYIEK